VEDDNALIKKVIYILVVDGDQPSRNVCSTQKIVCHKLALCRFSTSACAAMTTNRMPKENSCLISASDRGGH